MAQLNITLNQDEILQLIADDKGSAFKKLLQDSLNSILKAESAEQLKAAPYERTEERTGSRNDFRDRPLTTRIGQITLKVPKHRDGEAFKTIVFDNYCRSEAADHNHGGNVRQRRFNTQSIPSHGNSLRKEFLQIHCLGGLQRTR